MHSSDGADPKKVYPLVLAAGRSRRMGRQKLLLPWHGYSIIGRVVSELSQACPNPIHVVVGSDGADVEAALIGLEARVVINPRPDEGMLSSIRCGLRDMPKDAAAVLLALGDQPGITAEVVRQLIAAFDGSPSSIIVPTYLGRRGHPLLFSMAYGDAILTRFDEVGLRGLLDAHPDDVKEVAVSTPQILEDIDVYDDYLRLHGK